ncbi:STP1 protein [Plasmodium ovale wallikeri]|uniref:STP1 protein n=1 Tax=Plasmodium ovale wallikeri TaxID=864142 RepID=A0A1A9ANA9_PLAOA|nr:STP1 protein [Plasmodium ovale wallikeri]SBT57684.1 STP1 protein [Plasmodium ovale wallikeri]
MANDSGYSIHTHYIPIDAFTSTITNDIKNLIRKYGHKNCGLKHKELCDELKSFIYQKKTLELSVMDEKGKTKWNSEWSSKRNEFLNRLYDEEGFINMCFPKKYPNNQSLNQLLSKHIEFCKEKDQRLSVIGKNREYSVCLEYNVWIINKTTSFTSEYLQNVKKFTFSTVKKYFSTKEHPEGYNPLTTYRNIKLDCEIYNPKSKSYQPIPVENTPPNSIHPPIVPDLDQKSRGKGGSSIPSGDGGTEKNKYDVNIHLKTEPPASNSRESSPSKTKVDDTPNGQHDDLKAKGTVSPIDAQVAKGQPAEVTDAKAPSSQQLPESQRSITPKDSSAATIPNLPSVIKGQDTDPEATPSTTLATSSTTHSIENVLSPLTPDLSLVKSQPQPLPVDPGTDNNPKEPTSDPAIKSPAPYTPPTTALDPGLASAPAAASNSSASETSSTTVFTATVSNSDSHTTQDPLLITVLPQSTTTTSIVTTPALTQTTSVMSDPSTTIVSAMDKKAIPGITGIISTTEGHGNPQVPNKTLPNSQESTFEPPKKQDNTIPSHLGAQSPDPQIPSSSGASDNLNSNSYPSQTPGHLPYSPSSISSVPPPGLSFGISPERSPGRSPDVSSTVRGVVNKPDSKKITTSTKDSPRESKGTTLNSNTPILKVTYPIENPSIKPTEFPPLMNIIPTTLILLATLTILFLLYKYTPFGLFLGRRSRKKKDLRTVFEIPEESIYESSNETIHEWDDHLGRQIMENDVYVKLQKINRYKKEMQKKKKKRDTTLIEVHMEILEECKNDEWELHKGDFLEICLQEFINEKNRTAENWRNAELTVNNIKNDKIIQDAEEKEILWNFWMDNYRNILESWKSEEWFQNLKNEWKKERQKNHNKINKIEENTLKESGMISIECEKDIWKKWISKQATLIEMFKQEDWFKSLVAEQYKEEDNYEINEYINVSNTNINEFEKDKKYHEFFRKKNIINKLMVQMHMMVLEECKKEEIVENKELCIDNYIQSIHKKNNYDEKSNIL